MPPRLCCGGFAAQARPGAAGPAALTGHSLAAKARRHPDTAENNPGMTFLRLPTRSALHACLVAALLAAPGLTAGGAMAAPCPIALPVAGEFSSGFGYRGGRMHPGVDIRAPIGSEVRAAAGGMVIFAGRYFAYGIMLEIEHRDGSVARYAHLARINPGIIPGAVVLPGEPVAILGRTGRTTGPHLHVELRRDGRAVDPWPWLTRTACLADTEIAEAPR